jgi:hypothetical protein
MKKLKKIKYLKNGKKLLFDQFILINTEIGDFFKIFNVFKKRLPFLVFLNNLMFSKFLFK